MPRSRIIVIAAGIVIAVIVAVVFGLLPGRKAAAPSPTTLEFWGVGDDPAIWQDILARLKEQYPWLTVNYTRLDERTYEQTLINRLAEGRGPDIFVIKNSWVQKHRDKIVPLPQESFGFFAQDFANAFVDGASQDLITPQGAILGLPLYVDSLALFYNRDILNAAGIARPPTTWDDISRVSQALTQKTPANEITASGVAMGTGENVEHAFEVLSSLMLQNGDPIIDRASGEIALDSRAREAVAFYASFADPRSQNYAWNSRLKNSFDEFAQGRAAMAFGFSRDIGRVRAKNPRLNFGITPFPQLAGAAAKTVYADYYFPVVSRQSKNALAAWYALISVTSQESARSYLESRGLAPARRDLIAASAQGHPLAVFYRQSLIARSWPVPDEQASRRLFSQTIDIVLNRSLSVSEALDQLRTQLNLIR